jgi:two-component system sensor histidine kinase GlrK
VLGDAEQLRVVIDNLMTNALRFSPAGGVIDVKLYQRERAAVVEILDQGPGIDADETTKIFNAFYQGKAPDKELYKGTGLGLAIAEEYAKANHGSIEALASEHGGHFRLVLPSIFKRE